MSDKRARQVPVDARSALGPFTARLDEVAIEEPLEIRIAGVPLAVVMRTPGDDIELVAGFLFAEEIVRSSDDIGTIRHCTSPEEPAEENIVDVHLSSERRNTVEAIVNARNAERTTVTSSSCGVCGKRTIESLHATAKPFRELPAIDASQIAPLPRLLREAQQVFARTGGLHAAGIVDAEGRSLVVREDVGRHNAVDKAVGHLLLAERLSRGPRFLVVSGRASFEIVQKALVARIPIVLSISAPSSLAIDLARASNMGLVGFVRDGAMNVYSGSIYRAPHDGV